MTDPLRGPPGSALDKNKKKPALSDPALPSPRGKNSIGNVLTLALLLCCVLSAVNLLYAHYHHTTTLSATRGSTATHGSGPMHQAMKEFLGRPPPRQSGGRKRTKAKQEQQEQEPMDEEENEHATQEDSRAGNSGTTAKTPTKTSSSNNPYVAQLNCQAYGGPSSEAAQEMVYWQDIPSDSKYVSPFRARAGERRQYMTFEPDGGGWNNIRMAMETVLGLGIAMGRTIVMPPSKKMYLLGKDASKQKVHFGFADFFPIEQMAEASDGLELITMKEFLETEAMTGHLRDKYTGQVSFPPDNRTDWEGGDAQTYDKLREWLRNVTHTPLWSADKCMAAFPASGDHRDVVQLKAMMDQIHKDGVMHAETLEEPTPVDATPMERMRENLSRRKELCVYDEEMQQHPVVHFMCYHKMRVRMLVHFYAFLFFEDWREDLWMKRFMRDHVRYIDEIQCAAARIVQSLRELARDLNATNTQGEFDTFHVRRGDFQYKKTRITAEEIHDNTKDILTPGSLVFIATDERDKKFFDPLKEHYTVKFLDDYMDLLKDVNTNYYGMIDQLVASRGRLFFGCWHSTFSGFIHRMRGYHSDLQKAPGYEKGLLPNSYYYAIPDKKVVMHKYAPLQGAFFNREFPTSWRDLDRGIDHLPNVLPEMAAESRL